ncbi:MAG: LytTR family transcriptional regulator DNA-binding domain-containing protein [Bacteroidota bacterium]
MRIIAVEDNPILASGLEMLMDTMGYELTSITDNSEDFIRNWKKESPDLALVDIRIKGVLNGIEVAQVISNSENPIPIIFLTSLQDQKVFERAKRLRPFAYLLKPFDEKNLQRTIELAVARHVQEGQQMDQPTWQDDLLTADYFYIKVGNILKKLKTKDVRYVEADNKHVHLFTSDASYTIRLSLQEIMAKLQSLNFLQVQRSYVVNLNFVEDIHLKDQYLLLSDGTKIPFSKTYRAMLLERIQPLQ